MRIHKKGQSVLEFSVLIVIVVGAFIAMQFYVKRGIQGRWKTSIDDFGDQYDPRFTNSNVVYKMLGNSSTQIRTIKDTGGYWTQRLDKSNSVSSTQGTTVVGAEY